MSDQKPVARPNFPAALTRRRFLGTGAAALTGGAAGWLEARVPGRSSAASNEDRKLTITSFGGTFQKTVESEIVRPFEQETKSSVSIVTGISTKILSTLETANGHPDIDVAYMNLAPILIARRRNLLQKLDLAMVPSAKLLYPLALDKEGYWVADLFAMTGLVYNTDHIKTPPKSWADLWSPAYKGKVAIPDVGQEAGFDFLVAVARMHGGSERNVDPGFQAIKQLKPNLTAIYKDPDGISQLLTLGEAWIGPWYNDRFNALKKAGAPVAWADPKEGSVAILSCICVPAGAPHRDLAMRFIDFALSTAVQWRWDRKMGEAPTNRAVKLSETELTGLAMPYGADAVSKLASLDMNVVSNELPNWITRWQREITG